MLVYNDFKYRRIAERARQAYSVASDLRERVRDTKREIEDTKRGFQRSDGRRPTERDQQRLEKQLRPKRSDLQFLETELEAAEAEQSAVGEVANRLRNRLDELQREYRVEPDSEKEPAKPLSYAKGEPELRKIREKIVAAQERRDAIASAPLPPADAKAKVDEWLDEVAAEFDYARALVGQALSPDQAIDRNAFSKLPVNDRIQLTGLLAWATPESIRDRLYAEIDAQADSDKAVTAAERARQLAELDAELAQLGRDEEDLVARLEAGGNTIERRADVDPDIVLEVREVADPAPPPSTPEQDEEARRHATPGERVIPGSGDGSWATNAEATS